MRTTLAALALVAAAGLAACGGSSSSTTSATTTPSTATSAPSAVGSSTTAGATPTAGSSAFCSKINAVLTQFQAITSPTVTDITNAATAFDGLAAAAPASLTTSISAASGDFRQLAAITTSDPEALTREDPTPAESALGTKLEGDLTPLVTYQKSNCGA